MTDGELPLGDPLPHRRLLSVPAVGGVIKERAEDFFVEEIALYEPIGEGEHLYLRLQKTNVAHNELVSLLQRHFGVSEEAIGFAGMKDKLGVTQQTVSVHLPGLDDGKPLEHPRVAVLWSARHANKIRRGHLIGNRFAIRIRRVDPIKAPALLRQLRLLERAGIPDYYGYQRFGYRHNNHRLGLHLLREDWDALLAELLGARGSAFPEHQRIRREMFHEARHDEAAPLWTRGDRAERAAIEALRRGTDSRGAVLSIGHATLAFWISAMQSYVFNRVLDHRLDAELIDRVLVGDVAWKHDSRRCFLVSEEDCAVPEFEARVANFELSASGPLPGPGMMQPTDDPGRTERQILNEDQLEPSLFDKASWNSGGARRPLRVRVSNVDVDSGFDEHGPYIRVRFDLPRGAYATVVLRELIGEGAEHDPNAWDAEKDGTTEATA